MEERKDTPRQDQRKNEQDRQDQKGQDREQRDPLPTPGREQTPKRDEQGQRSDVRPKLDEQKQK